MASKVSTAETTLIHAVADHYFPGHRAFGAEIAAFKEACLAQGRAEGAEEMKATIRGAARAVIPEEYVRVDAEGCVLLDPTPFQSNRKDYEAKVFLVPASVLAGK